MSFPGLRQLLVARRQAWPLVARCHGANVLCWVPFSFRNPDVADQSVGQAKTPEDALKNFDRHDHFGPFRVGIKQNDKVRSMNGCFCKKHKDLKTTLPVSLYNFIR